MAKTASASSNPQSPTPDQVAAHEFLCELRTRITTQPLPYQYGVEARALESLWEVFGQARDAMKRHPGCREFADLVTEMLNTKLRPVTAKWHRAHAEGRLNARDGADEFRADLTDVQEELRLFAKQLHGMAYGVPGEDALSPPALGEADLNVYFAGTADIEFGIVESGPIRNATTVDKINTSEAKAATVEEINTAEAKAVQDRRSHYGITTASGKNAIGLALSGGGIRSATFSLGVVQVLAERGLLKDVDFLSTVSGGGYTGCFLTTRLGNKQPGSENDELHATVAAPHGPDPAPIRYLRQHAKYLAALNLVQAWLMATATFAGMLLNWTAPLLLVIVAALAAAALGQLPPVNWPLVMAVMAAASMLALVWYGWQLPAGRKKAASAGKLLAWTLALTTAVGACLLLQAGYDLWVTARHWTPRGWTLGVSGGVAAILVTGAPAIIRFVPVLEKPAVRQLVLKALLLLAGLVIPLGAIALFYALLDLGLSWPAGTLVLAGLAVVFALVAIVCLNINLTGPHRLYRDQLARTFIQPDETEGATVALTDINPAASAPYHLINATVNLPASTHAALRDRKSDFFLFSRHYCGSPATRYYATEQWKANNSPPDLATAMAVSGAAASAHMGLSSMPTLTALLTFLNLRLGFWILHPDRTSWFKSPGFLCLIREMTAIGMSEDRAWLNLSDGGHIENMGVYELLRRRCKFVICVDGEADPQYTFQGLMTLIRHAQIDFGVCIEAGLNELRPDPAAGCSQTHAVLCRIRYPNGPPGLLLYLKLSLTGNEPEMLRRYRLLHPDFPHQSTFDQFFTEEQFEAYRQLGVHVAESLFLPALTGGNTHPDSVRRWFRSLAANLLQPMRP